MATAALVLGIVGLFFGFMFIGIIPSILAVIFAIIVLRKKKNGMAIAGMVCGIIGILISVIVLAVSPSTEGTKSGSTKQSKQVITSSKESQKRKSNNSSSLANKMSVKTYTHKEDDDSLDAVLVVKNNSDKTVSMDANMTIKNASGTVIGAQDADASPVEPGKKAIISTYFDNAKKYNSLDYKLNVSTDVDYNSLAKNIDLKVTKNEDKLILTATNKGKETAYFLEVNAVFLKHGKMVGIDSTYLDDDHDDSIKPGKSFSGELNNYGTSFDDEIVTYTARDN